MVVPSTNPLKRSKKTRALGVPTIDLSLHCRNTLSHLILSACEDFGIFKVVNHGIPMHTIHELEDRARAFFSKPASEKTRAGPASPFGYGCRNIGPNGDMGELEYLLLHTNPNFVPEACNCISSSDPSEFRRAVNDYVGAVGELACEVLELVAEGMWVQPKSIFSSLLRESQSDSLLRLNHYPPRYHWDTPDDDDHHQQRSKIGFGEHSDPQILTVLRSNDVGGLQICMPDGLWLSVPPDPSSFFVMVGDALQVMTNGRLRSVKHRALANTSKKSRMSMMYFGAPPLHTLITPIPPLLSPLTPSLYKPFTWAEYKKALYASRLSDCRLNHFKIDPHFTDPLTSPPSD